MYTRFFGLRREPFSIAPDPHYLFMSERHREALAHLLYGVGGGGGFVLLTGQIGAGKTTVCRAFLEKVPATCRVAYVVNPRLSATELLQTVCDEFHVPYGAYQPGPNERPRTAKDYVDPLNAFLLQTHAQGHNALLVIDEAQQLSAKVLEQLRLLTNLETAERKLLQIVLIGQPELREMLAQPELEQLAQRVIARYHLDALDEADTIRYVRHRLGVAGLTGSLPFDAAALHLLHRLSGGIPRRINLLADRALLGAYGADATVVNRATVARAAQEVFGTPPAATGRAARVRGLAMGLGLGLGLLAALAAAAAAGAWAMARWQTPGAVTAPLAARGDAPTDAPTDAGAAAPSSAPAPSGATPAATASVTSPAAAALQPEGGPVSPYFDTEAAALNVLAGVWQLTLEPDRDACTSVTQFQTRCWRTRLSLGELRRLDRPGVVTLQLSGREPGRDPAREPAHAVLVALDPERAVLRGPGGDVLSLPIATFVAQWRGDFVTLWRTPEGYRPRAGDNPPPAVALWLVRQVGQVQSQRGAAPLPAAATHRARVAAFQTTQGLPADGVAGPQTLMQLNRAIGVPEPRLGALARSAPAQEAR